MTPTAQMLSRVTAKNVGDVFLRHTVVMIGRSYDIQYYTMLTGRRCTCVALQIER